MRFEPRFGELLCQCNLPFNQVAMDEINAYRGEIVEVIPLRKFGRCRMCMKNSLTPEGYVGVRALKDGNETLVPYTWLQPMEKGNHDEG